MSEACNEGFIILTGTYKVDQALSSFVGFDVLVVTPCRQIPWDKDEDKLRAWKEARTGFPWIDAAMTQLREEGCVLLRSCFSPRTGVSWHESVRSAVCTCYLGVGITHARGTVLAGLDAFHG